MPAANDAGRGAQFFRFRLAVVVRFFAGCFFAVCPFFRHSSKPKYSHRRSTVMLMPTWAYVERYAADAEIEPVSACQRVLKRMCDAVALILDTAESLKPSATMAIV